MKEKRVDIYLAKAGFAQTLLLTLGAGCLTELLNGNVLTSVLAAAPSLVAFIYITHFYKKAEHLVTKKQKRKL